jgi:hypothetical protein
MGFFEFIDSFQFLNSSLEKLVDFLVRSCDDTLDKFQHTRLHMGSNPLIYQKMPFPYEFSNSFNDTFLPSKDAFYSEQCEAGITDEEFKWAEEIWKTVHCKTFKDIVAAYVKSGGLLLTDTFESFRETAFSYFNLDPSKYLRLPGYIFDACLKFTNVTLE